MLESFINQRYKNGLINEILFFHLSRRLNGTEDNVVGRNLLDLLTTENEFSLLLSKKGIKFTKGEQHIEVYHRGKLIDWNKCWSGNSSYMQLRLGYFKGREDFCFNGFAFKDQLYKTTYARNLSGVPEFLGQLIECLERKDIGYYYIENSSYYCYEYKVPLDRVLFDDDEKLSGISKEKHIIKCVLQRLDSYRCGDVEYTCDHDNPILRLRDDDILEAEHFVSKEIITSEMLYK